MNVLIVGQGIAGTCLAFELLRRGSQVHLVDDGHSTASSRVGTAVINPVTGRRYAKSWNIDTLLPIAEETYDHISDILDHTYLREAEVLQVLPDDRVEEIWMLRAGDPEFKAYLDSWITILEHAGMHQHRVAHIHQARHLAINALLQDARKWFADQGYLSAGSIATADLQISKSGISWNDRRFTHVIFCTGHKITGNPLFNWLEVYPMKGEYLLCRIPGLALRQHIKSRVSLLPLGDDLYWCGATYDRYNDDPEPTQKGKSYLAGHLEKILDARYSIDFHGAGIRATTRDRRPYTGRHPEHERVHVIAGLGTKGASLAPYCANLFVDFLLDGVPIPGEVDILRHGHR